MLTERPLHKADANRTSIT